MTKAEEMAMKTVHDLGMAGVSDVYNYTGLSPDDATAAFASLRKKKIPQDCPSGVGIAKKRIRRRYTRWV